MLIIGEASVFSKNKGKESVIELNLKKSECNLLKKFYSDVVKKKFLGLNFELI